MKKEDLKAAFDQIQPGPDAENRMWNQIINQKENGKERAMKTFNIRRLVPVLGLVVVLAGSLLIYNMLPIRNHGMQPAKDIHTGDPGGREDAVAPVIDQFQLGNRHYALLYEELREEFGLPSHINEEDIGEKIASIESTPDESLLGLEVYQYIPAGAEAVVAVRKEGSYQLFRFFNFESYNNNQDEDASAYLKLYGINGPQDISAVRFIKYTEDSKVEGKLNIAGELMEPAEIEEFYGYYSVLKNASDKYFEKLFGYAPNADPGEATTGGAPVQAPDDPAAAEDLPPNPDTPVSSDSSSSSSSTSSSGMVDKGDNQSGSQGNSTSPSQGSAGNALADPIGVRIYNQNGVYYETMYYRNIGFLSRYEVIDEFAEFLHSHIR